MLDERNLRALSAMRTDLHRMWLALSAIGQIVDAEKADLSGELYHWQSGGNSLAAARSALRESAVRIENSITWLSPLEEQGRAHICGGPDSFCDVECMNEGPEGP